MSVFKFIQIGNLVGVILFKEVLVCLKVEKGDVFYLFEVVNGVLLMFYSLEFEEQMNVVCEIMKKCCVVLYELVK